MEEVLLDLDKREVTGKAVKRLRAEGLVPAVIHDHGKDSVHVTADYVPMLKAYQAAGKHHPVTLNASGKQYVALIKSVDFDPKKHQLRHVVFNAVNANEKVDAEIPVHIKFAEGNDSTPAERAGLVVLHQTEVVQVEAIASKLPDALYFDGEKLVEVGDHVTVADLIAPAGVTIKTDPSHPLATVFEPSALQAANDAAGGDAEEEAPAAEAAEGEESAEGEAKPEAKKE
ncbi:MAG TPA: 50S ribosomal protein L25 [Patescibacteria group bacterium]|nr:50S ribosomal protein L25 [Patescibacteria group bacterium]